MSIGGSMKEYFSIGELSTYQHISKQTLIYYDKIDLFKQPMLIQIMVIVIMTLSRLII